MSNKSEAKHPGEKLDQPIPADAIPTPATAAAPAASKKTVEEWAEAKGHYPQFRAPKPNPAKPNAVGRPVYNPKFQLFAAAKAFHGWAGLAEVTEAQYDEAILAANDPNHSKKNLFR